MLVSCFREAFKNAQPRTLLSVAGATLSFKTHLGVLTAFSMQQEKGDVVVVPALLPLHPVILILLGKAFPWGVRDLNCPPSTNRKSSDLSSISMLNTLTTRKEAGRSS